MEDSEVLACALTEVAGLDNPKRTVTIDFCAGREREKWQHEIVDEIRRWASEAVGAQRLRAVHRPGWKKHMRDMGFRMTHIVSEMDMD